MMTMLRERLTQVRLKVLALLRRRQLERDLNDELALHLEMHERSSALRVSTQ